MRPANDSDVGRTDGMAPLIVSGRRRERPETTVPGERARPDARRRALAWVLAVALPIATATALIPVQGDHSQLITLLLLVSVVIVAALGSTPPAVLSALVSSVAYAVIHTEPYGRFTIDDPDEAVTTIALLATATIVGVLCSRLVRRSGSDADRHNELRHLLLFTRSASDATDVEDLAAAACEHIGGVLHARRCLWRSGRHGDEAPVLLPDGAIMGYLPSLNPDRAKLPHGLEVPARVDDRELGRFLIEPDDGVVVSAEERYTAASIAALFARTAIQLR